MLLRRRFMDECAAGCARGPGVRRVVPHVATGRSPSLVPHVERRPKRALTSRRRPRTRRERGASSRSVEAEMGRDHFLRGFHVDLATLPF